MKNIIILLILTLVLTGCNNNAKVNVIESTKVEEQKTMIEESKNANDYEDIVMTLDQYNIYVKDIINYTKEIGNFSSQFEELVKLYSNKYNSAQSFNWSEYSRFNRLHTKISKTYQEISNYNLKDMSNDMRECFYKLRTICKITNDFYDNISVDLTKKEIESYASNYSREYEKEVRKLTYLQKKATISFLEKIGADQETIDEMKKELND